MTTRRACASCGGARLAPILSLGEMPLANAYSRDAYAPEAGGEARFPLDLVRCEDCALVQITEVVPPEILFRDYLYLSSYSTTMIEHARQLTGRLLRERRLGPKSLVVEVASNDGYLLQHYVHAGVPVLGIEPARNVAEIAERERGVRTVSEFFGAGLATELRRKGEVADIIHAHNVLAHVAALEDFVAGFRVLLADDGVLVSESPYLRSFVEGLQFDTIYHEHLYYYSLTSLSRLFRRHGLVVEDCELAPIHGGSLRIFVRHAARATEGPAVRARLEEEARWGVDTAAPYRDFAERVARVRADLQATVTRLRGEGRRVAAYGAAAKGTVLLNAAGLGADDIAFVCDKSPLKQGRSMPGVRVPIVDPARLLAEQPDYCLLLVWNIADEVRREQAEYVRRGGRFIVAIPSVVLDA